MQVRENKRTESLKQAIMMSYDAWGSYGDGLRNIEQHEITMIKILKRC
jgi:hypothetical protein